MPAMPVEPWSVHIEDRAFDGLQFGSGGISGATSPVSKFRTAKPPRGNGTLTSCCSNGLKIKSSLHLRSSRSKSNASFIPLCSAEISACADLLTTPLSVSNKSNTNSLATYSSKPNFRMTMGGPYAVRSATGSWTTRPSVSWRLCRPGSKVKFQCLVNANCLFVYNIDAWTCAVFIRC